MIRLLSICVCLLSANLLASNYYVATNGVDTGTGAIADPWATLDKAITIATSGDTIFIRGGTYLRTNTLSLSVSNSGIIFRGYTNETSILTGGKSITNFVSVTNASTLARMNTTARTSVLVSDLSVLGVSDYGTLTNRGASRQSQLTLYSGQTRPWMVELFFDNVRQQISRWPNQDISDEVWVYTTNPVPGIFQSGPTDNWFTYRETNPSTWALKEDVWVRGMWTYLWSDSYEQVISIATSTNAFITDRPGDYGYSANSPYEVLNVLEEIDQPGEWVIDRTNSLLYFWPPSTNVNQRTTLSCLGSDLVALTNVTDAQFINLTFECGRASGIITRDSTNILIAGCEFRNLGNMGVVVGNAIYTNQPSGLPVDYDYHGGKTNQIVGSYFHDIGEGGIVLSGGNAKTLDPSGHSAINNYFHDYNVNIRCYRAAIALYGVGQIISHATIHDSPHYAIFYAGNDHVIEYCNIYRVCKDTEDAGVIYSYAGDWKQRGTIIRYNLIQPSAMSGVYIDAFGGDVTIYGNVLMDLQYPVLIIGGRDNTIDNNIVVGFNNSPAWHINNLLATSLTSSIPNLVTNLELVDYTNVPYSKYPGMDQLYTDISAWKSDPSQTNTYELGMAKGNRINTNVFVSCKPYTYNIDTNRIEQLTNFSSYDFVSWTNFGTPTTFAAIAGRQFSLNTNSPPILSGFIQLPTSMMGVTNDSYGVVTTSMVPVYPPTPSRGAFKTLSIPGIVQVEDFDEGPSSNAWYNASIQDYGNNAWGSGRYRLESPFYIWGSLVNGARTYNVDVSTAGDWLEYTINASVSGTYHVVISYSVSMGGTFSLTLNGSQIATNMTAGNNSFDAYIPAGTNILRIIDQTTAVSRLDYMDFDLLHRARASTLRVGTLRGP